MAEEEAPGPPKPRNRQSRSRGLRKTTGCITCRRRHIRCNEEFPECARCVKAGRKCIYAAHVPNMTSKKDKRPSPVPETDVERQQSSPHWKSPDHIRRYSQLSEGTQIGIGASGSPQQPVSQEQSKQNDFASTMSNTNSTSETPRQVLSPVATALPVYAPTPFSMGSNDSFVSMPNAFSQPPFNIAVTKWFDMLAGDAAFENGISHFDMDDLNPLNTQISGEPEQRNSITSIASLVTTGETPEQQGAASPSSSSPQLLERTAPVLDQKAATEKLRWQASETIVLQPHEHTLFRNFVQHISGWIDLFDPTQSFSTFVPHLALSNVGLMKAILALSTRHLSLIQGVAVGHGHGRNEALQYYNETLHYLSKAMQYDTYKTSLELLATALIVSTYEMLDGSGKDWERHLQGVFWIQRSQVIHGDSKGLRQAVWWAWLCQDVWAAFREKRKAFTFWKPIRTFDSLSPHELAARAVYILAQVVNYCSKEESEAEGANMSARMEMADQLLEMLDDWARHLTTEFTPLPFKESPYAEVFQPIWIHPPSFGVSMQVHFSSRLLLLLNRPSRGGFGGYLQQGRLISKFVGKIVGIAKTLDDNASTVMSSQCLYIAGMCVQEPRQRDQITELINACRKRSGWPVISLAEELKVFWETGDSFP